jgi:hypothetical protein
MPSKINALIGFGLFLMVVGGLWMLLDEAVQGIEDMFGISSSYMTLLNMSWKVYPTFVFILGIIVVVIGVASSRSQSAGGW